MARMIATAEGVLVIPGGDPPPGRFVEGAWKAYTAEEWKARLARLCKGCGWPKPECICGVVP